jgi:hypothetical protein
MTTRLPQVEADEMVTVRLSQVPQSLRLQAADILVKKEGLTTFAALDMCMAAALPLEDPELLVPADKARLVIEEGRFPVGPFPVFG